MSKELDEAEKALTEEWAAMGGIKDESDQRGDRCLRGIIAAVRELEKHVEYWGPRIAPVVHAFEAAPGPAGAKPAGSPVAGAAGKCVHGVFLATWCVDCAGRTPVADAKPAAQPVGPGGAGLTPWSAGAFRKKPVVIYAEQFQPEAKPWPAGVIYKDLYDPAHERADHRYWIETLEGGHEVTPGDWIITGVKGEKYPCKPDIFALTYEPASAPLPGQGVADACVSAAVAWCIRSGFNAAQPDMAKDLVDAIRAATGQVLGKEPKAEPVARPETASATGDEIINCVLSTMRHTFDGQDTVAEYAALVRKHVEELRGRWSLSSPETTPGGGWTQADFASATEAASVEMYAMPSDELKPQVRANLGRGVDAIPVSPPPHLPGEPPKGHKP